MSVYIDLPEIGSRQVLALQPSAPLEALRLRPKRSTDAGKGVAVLTKDLKVLIIIDVPSFAGGS